MKKVLFILLLIVGIIHIFSEPYKPFPVLVVHGYNADNYGETNFGIVIQQNTNKSKIVNPTVDKNGDFYVSRNEGERIEYGKLVYQCAEYRGEVAGTLVAEYAGEEIMKKREMKR